MPGFDEIKEVNGEVENNIDEMTREIFMKEAAKNGWNLEGEADVLETVYDIYEGAVQMPMVDMRFWQAFGAFIYSKGKSKREVIDAFLEQTEDMKYDLDDYKQREALDELTDKIREYDPPEPEKTSELANEQNVQPEKSEAPKPLVPNLQTDIANKLMNFTPEEEQTYNKLIDKTCSFYNDVDILNHREVFEGQKHQREDFKDSEHTYTITRTGGFTIALYALAATKKYTFDQLMDSDQLREEKADMFDKVVQNSRKPATPEKQQWVAKQLYEGEKVVKNMAEEVSKKIDYSQPDLLHNKDFCHLTQLAFSQFDASQEMQRCKPEIVALAQKDNPGIKKFSDYQKKVTKNFHPLHNVASSIDSIQVQSRRLAKTNRTDAAVSAANIFAAHDALSNTISFLAEEQKKKDAKPYTALYGSLKDTQLKANYGMAIQQYLPVFRFVDKDPAMKDALIDKMVDGKVFGQLKGDYTSGIDYKLSDNAKSFENDLRKEAAANDEKEQELNGGNIGGAENKPSDNVPNPENDIKKEAAANDEKEQELKIGNIGGAENKPSDNVPNPENDIKKEAAANDEKEQELKGENIGGADNKLPGHQKGVEPAKTIKKADLIKSLDDKLRDMKAKRLILFNKYRIGHSDSAEFTAMTEAMQKMKEAAEGAKEPINQDENFKQAFLDAYKANIAYTAQKRKEANIADDNLTWHPKSPLGMKRYNASTDFIKMSEELFPDIIAADKQREIDEREAELRQSEETLEMNPNSYMEERLQQNKDTIKKQGEQCGIMLFLYGKDTPEEFENDLRVSLAESIAMRTVGHFYKECEESGIQLPEGDELKQDFDQRVAQAAAGIMARDDFQYLVTHNTPAVLKQYAIMGNGNRLIQQLSEAAKIVNEQQKNAAPKANEKEKKNDAPAME